MIVLCLKYGPQEEELAQKEMSCSIKYNNNENSFKIAKNLYYIGPSEMFENQALGLSAEYIHRFFS